MKKKLLISTGIVILLLAAGVFIFTNNPKDAVKNDIVEKPTTDCLKAGEKDTRGGIPTDEGLKSLKTCCEGIEEIPAFINEYNGECIGEDGGYGIACAPCGNGVCESQYGENKCTCQKDCE